MATKSENSEIAVLQTQMEDLGKTFKTFKDEEFREVRDGVKDIQNSLAETYVKKSEFRAFKWTTIPITIVGTMIITYLATYFLQSITKRATTSNQPTTSQTTTTNNPTGSTSTTSTKDTTPSATANAQAQADAAKPSDSQTSNGGATITLPKVP